MATTKPRKPFVMVFAGAGASKAVSPNHYPTTVEFPAAIPRGIVESPFYAETLRYLESRSEPKPDVEVLLWAMQELAVGLRSMTSNRHILAWFLENGRMLKCRDAAARPDVVSHFNIAGREARHALPAMKELVASIQALVYEVYKHVPGRADIERTWVPFLRTLGSISRRVELVTTNYDLVLEAVLEHLGKSFRVNQGYRGGTIRKLDIALWSERSAAGRRGLLTKLHGSVHWSRLDGEICIGEPLFKGKHELHPTIYPGFKGRPTDEPFLSLHGYFENCLRHADAIIFVGFAFRDEFIGDLCQRSLRPAARVISINPADAPKLAWFGGRFIHIAKTFDRDVGPEVAGYIEGHRV